MRQILEQEILDGAIRPGERLDERALADRFGVSRTPVREVLSQLGSTGLVAIRPGAGASVVRMSAKQLVNMMEVLIELEALAAGLAARRMGMAERGRLAAVHEESRAAAQAGDIQDYDRLNRELHELIYAGSRNEHLEQQAKFIRGRMRIYRQYPFQHTARPLKSYNEHDLVVKAILEGDSDAARMHMHGHMTVGGSIFVDMVVGMPAIGDTE
ncbi:DNA-binding GntR family transcriptional regulator [Azospirillum agricola]|uniref:GntR family transcriptional regulator n=1 Tax=Azospirillum agricola TaxID=1720247 RepID=UPI001F242C9C|nr:GntR family transcriptional regulator [Azospirillum agricola]MBP2228942.1 DNA-binding GntR family transcriptional regulator [Azospirillum agricola]